MIGTLERDRKLKSSSPNLKIKHEIESESTESNKIDKIDKISIASKKIKKKYMNGISRRNSKKPTI